MLSNGLCLFFQKSGKIVKLHNKENKRKLIFQLFGKKI